VRRSEFDNLLLRNSAVKGAQVLEGIRVTGVEFPADGHPVAQTVDEAVRRAPGPAASLSTHPDATRCWREIRPQEKEPASRQRGDLRAFHERRAARWRIRRQHQRVLVRARLVLDDPAQGRQHERGRGLPARVPEAAQELAGRVPAPDIAIGHPEMRQRMRNATLFNNEAAPPATIVYVDAMRGERYIMVGDAYAFVDPVFSSGVMMGMSGGVFGPTRSMRGCAAIPRWSEVRAVRENGAVAASRPFRGSSGASTRPACAACCCIRAIRFACRRR
jgi:hypothetical protein